MKTNRNFKLSLIGWMVAVLAWALLCTRAHGSDLVKGYTFLPTDRVTSTKLNNLVDAGYISTDFYTLRTPYTAPIQTDTLVVYSATASAFRKITLDYLLFSNTNLIALQTEDATPATNDFVLTLDISAGLLKKANLNELVFTNSALINDRTNYPTPDPLATYFLGYFGGAYGKLNLSNIFYNYGNHATFTNLAAKSPVVAADSVMAWDSVGNTNKQVLMSTLRNFATNGQPQVAGRFASTPASFVGTGLIYNNVHTLAGTPQSIRAVIVCQTAPQTGASGDLGYAVGDEVDVTTLQYSAGGQAFDVGANATTMWVTCRDITPTIMHKSSGSTSRFAITSANWKVKIYAEYFP